MREILFRGKRIDNGEWVYGAPIFDEYQWFIIEGVFECDEYACVGTVSKVVIPKTIGQYTGLTDKNGKKIFEGDIILFDYVGKNLGVNGTETVIFMSGKFGVEWGTHREFVCLDGFANTTLEIIGNIYDNFELLEGKA